MESVVPLSFSDFPEDVQLSILSFLRRSELEAFASTSKKFFALCNDEKLWFLRCSRRWGSHTQIKKWGGGKISYVNLFRLLDQLENLIGFWQYRHNSFRRQSPSQILLFEWGSFYITGFRVLPSERRGAYDVVKKPFLWITATSDGQALNYLDMNETISLTEKDLACEDSEKLRSPGLILVDIDLLKNHSLSLRENRQYLKFRKQLHSGNRPEEYDIIYRSPPDGLMAQIYEILGSKVSVTLNPPPPKKERRRERPMEREKQQRACRWCTEHFLKIMNPSPTPSSPLQGLWKGIDHNKSLILYLVSHNLYCDSIYCQTVGKCSTHFSGYHTAFTARATAFLESPISSEEERTYNTRTHLRPSARSNQAGQDRETAFEDENFDVLRIFHAFTTYHGYDGDEDSDGRVWLYANGTFGFGFLGDNYIVDLKPLLKNDCLLDSFAESL